MKVLIVGSGGREHAIAYSVAKSDKVDKIYCTPGNAGIAEFAECAPIGAMEFDKIVAFAKEKEIDLVIVGMDDPLVGGLVDELEAAGIRKKGVGGWIKSFTEPIAIVTPINILEVFIKPLSLCMRLFGNVLGAFVIMELLKLLVPVALPVPFSFYFDIFDGLIQAYVFVFLTSMYIKEAIE